MKPEVLHTALTQTRAVVPEAGGAAILSRDGHLLYSDGDLIADQILLGVAGSAVMHIADVVSGGLEECPDSRVLISCRQHEALFVPIGALGILVLVLPQGSADPSTIHASLKPVVQWLAGAMH